MGSCCGKCCGKDKNKIAAAEEPSDSSDTAKPASDNYIKRAEDRRCTDILFLILYIIGWLVFLIVTLMGVADGVPSKLFKPRDFSGAYCGVSDNWNNGPNHQDYQWMAYTMNVSSTTETVAKQLLCSGATSTILLGPSSPLTASQQETYGCACCITPCASCESSHDLGKGGDIADSSKLTSTVDGKMSDLKSFQDNGVSLFNPAGAMGDFASKIWGQATEYFYKACVKDCKQDFSVVASATADHRTYTYTPAADSTLRSSWDVLLTSTDPAVATLQNTLKTQFTFRALPKSVCNYEPAYCVPFPGVKFAELPGDYCGFEMTGQVQDAVGNAATAAFQSLAGTSFQNVGDESFGTMMGDFEKSIDSFVIVALLSFVIGLIFLVILRFSIGCCVWFALILTFVLFLVGGGIAFVRSGQCEGAGLFDTGQQVGVAVTVAGLSKASNAIGGGITHSEAMDANGNGADYRGTQERTRSGRKCKDWSQAGPKYWPDLKDSAGLEENFCRNPYNTSATAAPTIWCFTEDPSRKWEVCSPVGVIQPECSQGYAVPGESSRTALKVFAGLMWAFSFIWILMIFCFCSRIRLAISLNQVAAQFLSHKPYIVVVPIVQAIVGIIWNLLWALSVCFLLSQVPDGYVPKEAFATYAEAYGTTDTPGKCTGSAPVGSVWKDETCKGPDPKCWRCAPPRFNLDIRFFISFFVYLWNNAFLMACGQCIIAGCVGVWFFTPNKEKGKVFAFRDAIYFTFRFHTGSLACGAFILAVVQFIRYVMMYFEAQAKQQKNRVVALVLKCLQYLIWCFERFIEFLNKNAYIQVALKGTSFCTSAWNAWKIILANMARFGIVAVLGRVIHGIGYFFIMMCTVVLGYFVVKGMHPEISPAMPLLLYLIVSYMVGKLYMAVFGLAVDTSLQCVIEAEELDHDGSFVPSCLKAALPAKKAPQKDDGKDPDQVQEIKQQMFTPDIGAPET